ncbi:MAG TPA: hypothetical protein VFO89_05925, partial [Thermoanaerobaculia bacterium]|nr:hypothetical protein [Thermoanaerobaculia bacterium]
MASSRNFRGIRIGLRSKMVAAFATQAIIIAVFLVGIEQLLVRRAMMEQTVEHGAAIARTVEVTVGEDIIFGVTDRLKKITSDLQKNPSVTYAEFLDANENVLAATAAARPPLLLNRALTREQGADIGENLRLYTVLFFESPEEAAKRGARPKGYFRMLLNESQAEEAVQALRGWTALIT